MFGLLVRHWVGGQSAEKVVREPFDAISSQATEPWIPESLTGAHGFQALNSSIQDSTLNKLPFPAPTVEVLLFKSPISMKVDVLSYLVISQNRGTPIETPKYYCAYYGDPKKGSLILGKHHLLQEVSRHKSTRTRQLRSADS